MTYREKAIEVVKIAGQELIDRAEEFIVNTEGIKSIDIWIKIPSETDDPYVVPEIQVDTEVYPRRGMLEKLVNLRLNKEE